MQFGAEIIDLTNLNFTPELLSCIPKDTARRYRVLPLFHRPGHLMVALANSEDLDTLDTLTHLLQTALEIRVAERQQLDDFIHRLYGD
jgi:hypothetical protein